MNSGNYRNIVGNQATAIGLIAAANKSGLSLFYGGYPITPASDILHELAKHKNFNIKTFQSIEYAKILMIFHDIFFNNQTDYIYAVHK